MPYETITVTPVTPRIGAEVLVGPIRATSPEASRIIEYARRAVGRPVEIRNTPLDGLFVEYALVVDWPATDRAAA